VYLGHARMMMHLRKFPDHSNMDEYVKMYDRARVDRKGRPLSLVKLKQVSSFCFTCGKDTGYRTYSTISKIKSCTQKLTIIIIHS